MEQLNDLTNDWIRFPIKVTERDLYEDLDGKVPQEEWVINRNSVVAIRPYVYQGKDKVSGTLICTTSGENRAVEVHPKRVREILNIKPFKVEPDEF